MSTTTTGKPTAITDRFIRTVCARLADNQRVRRRLPIWGRLHVDRQLPFLCVYRRPTDGHDEGTEHLVTSEASYLIAPAARKIQAGLSDLVQAVTHTLAGQFGAFLVLELWSAGVDPAKTEATPESLRPHFDIVAPPGDDLDTFLDTFDQSLSRISIGRQATTVNLLRRSKCGPKSLPPILSATEPRPRNCFVLGLQVGSIYRDPNNGELYPRILRDLERQLTRALRQAFFDFTRMCTTQRPKHYHVLGRRAVVKAVWEVDRQLAEVSDSFDFLLQVTPVNAEQAWHKFESRRFECAPSFHYRPLTVDPLILKRKLYRTPIERIEDPALALLFREKQDELDRRIMMLADLNTKRFVHGSVQLFGELDDTLVGLARQILERVGPRTRDDSRGGYLSATAFAARARAEIEYYRQQSQLVKARVRLRGDIAGGLMVSRGALLVSEKMRIPAARIEALLQHEVGTHLLTYYNGYAQPFRQLYSGLAGYEPLQEGLAVLAEYLVGGLNRPRLRLLAGRVLAARHLLDGASFVETFQQMRRIHRFDQRTAFNLAMRTYRGGGLTKDAVYLRGLHEILQYLGRGGALKPLFVGKIAANHIRIIQELQWRKVLHPAPLRPRYLDAPGTAERLNHVRSGVSVLQLLEEKGR